MQRVRAYACVRVSVCAGVHVFVYVCACVCVCAWRCAGVDFAETGVRMCCFCCFLSVERAGASMVPGLARMSELCFNAQCAASTCTVRSMPRKQS